jgi:AraC-like DNA-binding protein
MLMIKLQIVKNWQELARQAQWSASVLARQCGVSVRTLHRFCLKKTGKNLKTWLAENRLRLAVELLCDGTSIKETATRLGYKSPSNFARHYKHQTGHSPSREPPANHV